ncbi:MAG TPA: hypothetical protein PLH39_09475 [Promineifilum sp.]|nr:hypothetical protein [Promineifilum sp.]
MTMNTDLNLSMMRAQLTLLEREMSALRRLIDQIQAPQSQVTFEGLAGVWQGTVFSDEDLASSRLTISESI